MNELRERLADLCHKQWCGWMVYLFEKSICNEDGSITIPPDLVKRWNRQIQTNYYALPEKEKDSDRIEADKFIREVTKGDVHVTFQL